MLRISKLTDYGTLILAHMAGVPDRVHSATGLAGALGLGLPTVSKVLKTLGRHTLVTSQRGAHGGYVLSRPAGEISVADVIDALEDHPFGLTECSAGTGVCGVESDCRIRDNWLRINSVVRQALQAVTVADMVHPQSSSPFGRLRPTGEAANINDSVNLPVGANVTYSASCTVAAATSNGTVISNTATVSAPAGASDPNGGNNSATDDTTVIAGSGISGTKTLSGNPVPGGSITYTIVLSNAGPGPQADNPGDEFVDVLPAQVAHVSSSASSGTVANAGNMVTWNGAIPAGGSVTITIDAIVASNANGAVTNQGTINFDSDGNGDNDASGLTDDPSIAGAADPTGFLISRELPTLGPLGMILLGLCLAAIWYRREGKLRV